jgi:hypothetical protein
LLPVQVVGDKVYVQLEYSEQAAVIARQLAPHPLNSDSQVLQLHLLSRYRPSESDGQAVAESLFGEAGVSKNVVQLVPCGEYFPSPGYVTEKVQAYLAFSSEPLAQASETDMRRRVTLELETVLQLCEQGYIRCPRVTALAHIAAKSCELRESSETSKNFSTTEKAAFLSLMNQGSELLNWLLREAPGETFDYLRYPRFRTLLNYLENERGLTALTSSDPVEARFFRAFVPIFGAFASDESWKWTSRVHHDMEHFLMGDFSPFVFGDDGKIVHDANGHAHLLPKEEWMRSIIESECEAVFRSDIEAPLAVGIEKGQEHWRKQLARSFTELSLRADGGSASSAARAILTIERDLIIPAAIISQTHYQQHRAQVLKLLEFGVLDRAQLSIFYDNWKECPAIAELGVQFGALHTSEQSFRTRAESELYKVLFGTEDRAPYTEGSNPLKAAFSKTINIDCEVLSYRLAYLSAEIARANLTDSAEAMRKATVAIETLCSLRRVLIELRNSVTDTEMSDRNLQVYRLLRSAQATIVADAQALLLSLKSDTRYLSPSKIEALRGRSLEAFRSQFSEVSPSQAYSVADVKIDLSEAPPLGPGFSTKLAVLRLEKQSFKRLDMEYPYQEELAALEVLLQEPLNNSERIT